MTSGNGIYQDWADFLTEWAAGRPVDATALPRLAADQFADDTWERLVRRITDAMSARLDSWATAVTNGLPPDLRAKLVEVVDRHVTGIQQGFEEELDRLQAKGGATRQLEARRRTIRENPLTAVSTADAAHDSTGPVADWFAGPAVPRGRRVIVD
jgi:hypothetical protein